MGPFCDLSGRSSMKPKTATNPAGAVDAPICFLFRLVHDWWRASKQHR
jgi:hypothetical protein